MKPTSIIYLTTMLAGAATGLVGCSGDSIGGIEPRVRDMGTGYDITVEAETGSLIAPMAKMFDPLASNGRYIAVPGGGGRSGGSAAIPFTVPIGGEYAIWARVLTKDTGTNSFYLSIDRDLSDEDTSDNDSTIWDLQVTMNEWKWVRVTRRTGPNQFDGSDLIATLSPGSHTLFINDREDGTKLDRLRITSDLQDGVQ